MVRDGDGVCPLCGTARGSIVHAIDTDRLRRAYATRHGVGLERPGHREVRLVRCEGCRLQYYWPQWCGDESFYEQLGRNAWYYLQDKEEYELVRSILEGAERVLEVGAGIGALARKVRIGSYVGLELNERAASRARSQGVDVRLADVRKFASDGEGRFDCVCMFQVLEHIKEVRDFLEASIRCLSENGVLLISVPNDNSFVGAESSNILNMPPHHATRWNESTLRWLGDGFDLEVVGIYEELLADYHIKNYARCVASVAMGRVLRREGRMLDAVAGGVLWRASAAVLGVPLEIGLRCERRLRPRGHSIVGVFRRRH